MNTHEEKLFELFPERHSFPHSKDDCICDVCAEHRGYNYSINDCFNAIKDKVIFRDELLTEDEIFKILCENNRILGMKEISKIIHEAQNKKAGLV